MNESDLNTVANHDFGFTLRLPADSAQAQAEKNERKLHEQSITETSIVPATLGDKPAVRLDHVYALGDIPRWASRSYFMTIRESLVCLNMGTSAAEVDAALLDTIAASFRAIETGASIVFVKDSKTPPRFITGLLVETFNYRPDEAMQRLVRINEQGESVVAMVEAADAAQIVEQVNRQCADAGYGLICRLSGQDA